MYIVYENDNMDLLRSKYLVLELDTIEFLDGKTVKAFAVVDSEHVTFQELPTMDETKELHRSVVANYHNQDWDLCLEQIEQLRGSFRGELDTFYDELADRIGVLKTATIAPDWTGNIQATQSE